jgi:hypothetical protein
VCVMKLATTVGETTRSVERLGPPRIGREPA